MSDKEAKDEEKQEPKKVDSPERVPRRRNRRAGDRGEGASSMWLVSFTDVMALMLTFFVLLFSMSNPKEEDWKRFTNEVQENFNRFQGRALNRGAQDAINIERVNFSKALNLTYLQAIIDKLVEKEPALSQVRMIPMGTSLIISLPQNLLFDAGQATVKELGNQALFSLAGTLSRVKNRIEVVGHTDPRPVTGGDFPSNWELSLARATNVAAVLENVGYTRPITVRGHASARYEDLSSKIAVQERLDLSRRVDVVVMEDDGRRFELFDLGIPIIR